jgi:outer membrane lipoprotein-sorting protein
MRLFSFACIAILSCSLGAVAADLDSLETEIGGKWDKVQTLSYDMESTTTMAGEGFAMNSACAGTTEMKRKDDKCWLCRSDSKTTTTQKIAGQETKTEMTSLMIVDADFMYTLSDVNGQKTAMKCKADAWSKAMGKNFIKTLREENNVEVLPDETVDGVACYALSATPKKAAPNQGKMKFCLSKESGMVLLTQSFAPDGKVISNTKIKNLKLNPALADDRFVFTAPAGVQVQDMTNPGAADVHPPPAEKSDAKKDPPKDEAKDEPKDDKSEKKKKDKKSKLPF